MKPMLIFQLPNDANRDEKDYLTKTIQEGFTTGCLIVDSGVTILSFDADGNMNYCTKTER